MEFKLPDIGEGVHEGEIVRWLVKAGDPIAADQPMVEVMTDKATVEIPSPVAGTVEALFAKEGETVLVGKTIVKIAETGKAAAKVEAPAAKAAPAEAKKPVISEGPVGRAEAVAAKPTTGGSPASRPEQASAPVALAEKEEDLPFEILATPATRKLARELEVSLRNLKGTGPAGRITKVDVQKAFEVRGGKGSSPAVTSVPGAQTPAPQREVTVVARGELKRVPLRGIRKKIAEAMAHSKHTAAHFTYVEECDMTAVVKLRGQVKEEAKKKGLSLTFLPFVIKALVPVLKEFPYLNSSLDEQASEIVLKGDYNIGIATDTPAGLMVPVIKGADQKSIWDLAAEIATLSEKARNGKAALDELRGGTFTITNAGSIGGVFATPVINMPEVAILGVNAIRKRAVVTDDDEIVVRHMMYLSLSVDHRIVDGADAARFMNRLVYFLSEPTRLVFA